MSRPVFQYFSGVRRGWTHSLHQNCFLTVVTGLAVGIGFHALPRAGAPAASAPSPPQHAEKLPLPPTALLDGSAEVAVLMYHDVTDRPAVYFDTTVADFRRQMEQLRDSGARVVSLEAVYDHLRLGEPLPGPAVALTFDDGYLGQYRHAYPILKEFGFPATFFVHTGTVGRTTGKPHMTWEQLRVVEASGLVRVESHTVTHPEDLRLLSDADLRWELAESKQVLEREMARRVRFLAYPVGNADGRVARFARDFGYEMAFTMGPGRTASPEDALMAPRVTAARFDEVRDWIETSRQASSPAFRSRVIPLTRTDMAMGHEVDGIVDMRWIAGGRLSTARVLGRHTVPNLVERTLATAGLNGTFFSDARINSVGSGIVGPVLSRFGPGFAPGLPGDRVRIAGRPLVVIAPDRMAFLPFRPHLALDEDGVQRLLSGATDCFVAGAWLVHQGRPIPRDELEFFDLDNVQDFRPRAFIGVDRTGRPFLGACTTSNKSDRVAETLAGMGLEECVLLDSGYSTSLTLSDQVLISGIKRPGIPARPVPHFLLLHPVDPATGREVARYTPQDASLVGPPYRPGIEDVAEDFSLSTTEMEKLVDQPRRRKRRRHS